MKEKAEQIATRHKATIILDGINGTDRSYEIANPNDIKENVNEEEKLIVSTAAAIFGANKFTNTPQNISVAVGAARGILAYVRDEKAQAAYG